MRKEWSYLNQLLPKSHQLKRSRAFSAVLYLVCRKVDHQCLKTIPGYIRDTILCELCVVHAQRTMRQIRSGVTIRTRKFHLRRFKEAMPGLRDTSGVRRKWIPV